MRDVIAWIRQHIKLRRCWRAIYQLLVIALLAAPPGLPSRAYGQENSADSKALFLYNFANFVRWPEAAFANNSGQLRLCLLGEVDLGVFLDQVNGTRIRDKRLSIIRSADLKEMEEGCHVLFVGQDKRGLLPTLFEAIQHVYVLSVSDGEDFARTGGVISIVRTSDKLSFEINLDAAQRNGLLISSDLLSMARIVGRDGRPVDERDLSPEDSLLRSSP